MTSACYREDILVNADYLGQGYGIMGAPEEEAIHLFARQRRTAARPGLHRARRRRDDRPDSRQDFFKPGETVLFWHTGGQPALFADTLRRRAAPVNFTSTRQS